MPAARLHKGVLGTGGGDAVASDLAEFILSG